MAAHHAPGGGFRNPWPSYTDHNGFAFLTKVLPANRPLAQYALPTRVPDWPRIAHPREPLQAAWLGHATVLAQLNGFNVLTDPFFSVRASPVQCAGPARFTRAPCALEDLPPVHVALFSHNHYDHIDAGSVKALAGKSAADAARAAAGGVAPFAGTLYVCPLGVAPLLAECGAPRGSIVELDWWSEVALARGADGALRAVRGEVVAAAPPPPLRVVCVPAQHHSARTAFDRFATLWAGFVVAAAAPPGGPRDTLTFYFSGDTGYRAVPPGVVEGSAEEAALPRCPAFAEIGARFGRVDLAALPIGAYSPRWFMSAVHASPEDAVDMFRDVRAARAVAMHWGTLPLTDEPIEEPPSRLAAALAARGVPAGAFVAVRAGAIVGATLAPEREDLVPP
jgi:N-acyl-phosphatidylethanolamine-hydrolysing phospholipase D